MRKYTPQIVNEWAMKTSHYKKEILNTKVVFYNPQPQPASTQFINVKMSTCFYALFQSQSYMLLCIRKFRSVVESKVKRRKMLENETSMIRIGEAFNSIRLSASKVYFFSSFCRVFVPWFSLAEYISFNFLAKLILYVLSKRRLKFLLDISLVLLRKTFEALSLMLLNASPIRIIDVSFSNILRRLTLLSTTDRNFSIVEQNLDTSIYLRLQII
ncbi:hypothetical protein PHYBLDRAFT_171156 [Phycomyces blakesleeanus NRRL 1555(-)]|uniref:Uncharacterized protein n=1 Tax=Phycomyces blakesleeanus (strain ATCC 8743b / DSM 1359 / FGSC 10004 / NBRC 33097 / NRRL 1555) TaxID=763407 RepID=A0A162TWM5_PHYB8|nr:hypothetical protein PHYBLDRAFT_171156 [Phycomyces blakesleeanus NRRL 1555(-)]OAD70403.1 hypothetical protein PHYBLDRAFT_171156 [Phycomyces blakesleeanus NRRL 1555(-)]|eukprot:XP_018288443.1 hypothetical protein PHYBLDRAFT_171156 [Phycomyces blakesleeanus NRRL 1555(-)]